MGESSSAPSRGVVLHLLPYDLARGAQRYARALVDQLDSHDERHLIVTLFSAPEAQLEPDIRLDVPQGALRRLGLDPRAVLRLRKEVRRLDPAVVVAHGGEPAKYSAFSLRRGTRSIYYKIGTVSSKVGTRLSGALHRWYTKKADVIAAVSNDVADEARRLVSPSPDMVVIPNARDPELYRPAGSREPGPPRLIFVGYLDEGKRPAWFVDAVEVLRERGLDFEAVLVGGGPLEARIRPRAEAAGVEMVGNSDDVAGLMRRSDVFVFPSRPRGEGMPGVLIEAGLSGLATVSTRVAGAGDVVEHGVTGLLVDIDDRAGFIEGVAQLVGDETMRRSMGAAARDRCEREFTLEASVRRWRAVLDDVRDRVPG